MNLGVLEGQWALLTIEPSLHRPPNNFYIYLSVCVCDIATHTVVCKGQLSGIGSLLPFRGSQELNSGHQVYLKFLRAILPALLFFDRLSMNLGLTDSARLLERQVLGILLSAFLVLDLQVCKMVPGFSHACWGHVLFVWQIS